MLEMLEFHTTKRRRYFPKLNFPHRLGHMLLGQLQNIYIFLFLAEKKAKLKVHTPVLVEHMCVYFLCKDRLKK